MPMSGPKVVFEKQHRTYNNIWQCGDNEIFQMLWTCNVIEWTKNEPRFKEEEKKFLHAFESKELKQWDLFYFILLNFLWLPTTTSQSKIAHL